MSNQDPSRKIELIVAIIGLIIAILTFIGTPQLRCTFKIQIPWESTDCKKPRGGV